MYSNKFAAKLMNIRRLCKENVRNLSIFMVLSTHYPTFRMISMTSEQKESHRVDMENLKKSLHEESERNIQRLEESHKREMDALRTQLLVGVL